MERETVVFFYFYTAVGPVGALAPPPPHPLKPVTRGGGGGPALYTPAASFAIPGTRLPRPGRPRAAARPAALGRCTLSQVAVNQRRHQHGTDQGYRGTEGTEKLHRRMLHRRAVNESLVGLAGVALKVIDSDPVMGGLRRVELADEAVEELDDGDLRALDDGGQTDLVGRADDGGGRREGRVVDEDGQDVVQLCCEPQEDDPVREGGEVVLDDVVDEVTCNLDEVRDVARVVDGGGEDEARQRGVGSGAHEELVAGPDGGVEHRLDLGEAGVEDGSDALIGEDVAVIDDGHAPDVEEGIPDELDNLVDAAGDLLPREALEVGLLRRGEVLHKPPLDGQQPLIDVLGDLLLLHV